MKEDRNLQAVHTHTHTSNFMENKKAEKAFLKIEKRADYDLLILSLKAR